MTEEKMGKFLGHINGLMTGTGVHVVRINADDYTKFTYKVVPNHHFIEGIIMDESFEISMNIVAKDWLGREATFAICGDEFWFLR